MKINIDDIEKLEIANLGIEYWNDIFQNVKYNVNQIIKDNLAHMYLKYPIEIDFYLNQNIKNDPNAYAEKISDRKKAIEKGIKLLKNDDLLIIAGKGHEDYQIIGNTKIHLDDREIIKEAIG